jgi:hypothetical protein
MPTMKNGCDFKTVNKTRKESINHNQEIVVAKLIHDIISDPRRPLEDKLQILKTRNAYKVPTVIVMTRVCVEYP